MRNAALLVLAVSASAAADYMATQACWPGVTVLTSEDLYRGSKYRGYPIAAMFDGDPATAWVFKSVPLTENFVGTEELWGGKKAVAFEFEKPVLIDGFDIMNGYNKSVETFYRNDRVTALRVFRSSIQAEFAKDRIATAKLEDYMGWHHVTLPKDTYSALKIVFDAVAHGRDRDLCISEIRFTYQGKPVDLRLPAALMETSGSECGCGTTYSAVNRSGKELAHEGGVSEGSTFSFSPNGRFVVGFESKGEKGMQAWVVDLMTAAVVMRRTLPFQSEPEVDWLSERRIAVAPFGLRSKAAVLKIAP